jgi:DNA-binding transcriptional MerR regulator
MAGATFLTASPRNRRRRFPWGTGSLLLSAWGAMRGKHKASQILLDPGTGSSPYTSPVKPNTSTRTAMHSGELARLAGVSTDTLRYYERRRLLPSAPRSASGYRLFPPEALARVRLIRAALSIGFSVEELAAIFCERDRGGAPCKRVRALAAEKLAALEAQLRHLRSWRRELRTTLAEWDRLLRKTPQGQRAGLLEAFAANHPANQGRNPSVAAPGSRNRQREKQQ